MSNVGTAFTPGNTISVKDAVPAGMTYVSGTGSNWSCAPAAGTVTCGYTSTALFNTGAHLYQLTIIFSTKTPKKYENCAVAGIAPHPGPHETNLANNRDCTSVIIDPKQPPVCLAERGALECDQGQWVYKLTVTSPAWANAIKATSLTSGVSVPSGPISLNPAAIPITGPPGTSATLEVCAFNQAAAASGKPYDCCRANVTISIPTGSCGVRK